MKNIFFYVIAFFMVISAISCGKKSGTCVCKLSGLEISRTPGLSSSDCNSLERGIPDLNCYIE
ncbi:MAG: hypothetical protein IT275_00220 [Chitinophagales bacterium]|nr:hypothetical protein [Chitinophagales bacterium]HMV15272.1 hypothetical protein [Chitinophagales bacterium]HMW13732.1 hypothetical protein [Chitinophagales bacterium]HMX60515.1 hypothetical protein [Chitinophagales bacterium]HMY22994.1 hypothetical protein [Chitinophagales bacterium]